MREWIAFVYVLSGFFSLSIIYVSWVFFDIHSLSALTIS